MTAASRDTKFFGAAGAIGLFLGVAFGAFAAHVLDGQISSSMLHVFETGVTYQIFHSLALLAVAFFVDRARWFRYAGACYIVGIVLFSFSLYVLAMTGTDAFGFLTPVGGVSLLAGHVFLLLGFLRS